MTTIEKILALGNLAACKKESCSKGSCRHLASCSGVCASGHCRFSGN